ncbi:CoA-transferase family III domain-containing protein [Ilyonectria robusta]|uniref:CoA-transferase family III domain-containing protein n=1 Tax=Ilyonectria robusta TaxID=1079257 RepID=UPI001E8EE828|nr:CoA-transferase family III domain-containing protein [Ilyonectria robusta]KAH8714308.1 CoA-transferase family III domain-containing protein [Ilyonectria robusta]
MDSYSVQQESERFLHERVLNDKTLLLPSSFSEAAKKIKFVGQDPKPFIPTPCKITESVSALSGLVAAAASAVASDRYGIDFQDAEVDTDLATLFLESILLPTVNGKSFLQHPHLQAEFKKGDLYAMNNPIHQEATNVYKTKDGRWYHLHGSMNATATMDMIGVDEQDVTREEAIKIYAEKVAQHDAEFLERKSNEEVKEAGVTCLTPEEFFASEQGKIMGAEPLWNRRSVPAPRSSWPQQSQSSEFKPLAGIRVIDFSRVIAAPVISKILAVLGAEVVKVTSEHLPDISITWLDLNTGKKDTNIDLKSEEGKNTFSKLIEGADVLVDGYRPGVLARLGFDSATLRNIKGNLVYARENCYGFKGPLAYRSGWQQISDCLVGISWLQGKFMGLDEPVVPLLPNSDYQTGLIGAAAILQALLERTKGDETFDVDVSLTQYNIWYYQLGQYDEEQSKALLARNEGFHVRHYDEMQTLLLKSYAAILKVKPDILERPGYFWEMTGKDWGMEDDIKILAPPFKLAKSKLEYIVPSGSKGRSKPEW